MPPVKVEIANVDVLLLPLVMVALPPSQMPLPPAEIMPELLMPPAIVALLVIRMPVLLALMMPAFDTEPVTALLLMVIPVCDGEPAPLVVRTPKLLTLPETTAPFSMRMQFPVGELLLNPEGAAPPFWMIWQFCANAGGAPPPSKSAATELDASRSRSRRPPTGGRK